jgi:hypothetical protein
VLVIELESRVDAGAARVVDGRLSSATFSEKGHWVIVTASIRVFAGLGLTSLI